jgi:hypothetical protein
LDHSTPTKSAKEYAHAENTDESTDATEHMKSKRKRSCLQGTHVSDHLEDKSSPSNVIDSDSQNFVLPTDDMTSPTDDTEDCDHMESCNINNTDPSDYITPSEPPAGDIKSNDESDTAGLHDGGSSAHHIQLIHPAGNIEPVLEEPVVHKLSKKKSGAKGEKRKWAND